MLQRVGQLVPYVNLATAGGFTLALLVVTQNWCLKRWPTVTSHSGPSGTRIHPGSTELVSEKMADRDFAQRAIWHPNLPWNSARPRPGLYMAAGIVFKFRLFLHAREIPGAPVKILQMLSIDKLASAHMDPTATLHLVPPPTPLLPPAASPSPTPFWLLLQSAHTQIFLTSFCLLGKTLVIRRVSAL